MKKFFSMMAVLAAMFAFVACETTPDEPVKPGEGSKLATPELSVEKTETSFTVKWNPVTNAQSYNVKLEGESKTNNTKECQFTFSNLNAGTYKVRVQALADGYKNSDPASITVDIDGLSEADWFDLTLDILDEPYVTEQYTYTSYNSVVVGMSGEGVTTVYYAVLDTASIEGVSKAEIKKFVKEKASAVSVDGIQDINNPEKDYATIVGGCVGSTEYTCFAVVTNADGLEAMVSATATTADVIPTEDAKKWFGTWTVKSHKIYSMGKDGKGDVSDKEAEFTVNITASNLNPAYVTVDGFSVLGEGWTTDGIVEGDTLFIMNGTYLGDDVSQEGTPFGYYWAAEYSELGLQVKAYPSNVVTMATDGNATSTNIVTMYDGDGKEYKFECYWSDVVGLTESGELLLFIESWPAVFRTGNMEWTKVSATPSTLSTKPYSVKSMLTSSLVVAK